MKRALLVGAGFSYDLGMPLSSELTEVFLGMFTEKNTARLVSLLAAQEPFGGDRPVNRKAIEEAFALLLQYKADKGGGFRHQRSCALDPQRSLGSFQGASPAGRH